MSPTKPIKKITNGKLIAIPKSGLFDHYTRLREMRDREI